MNYIFLYAIINNEVPMKTENIYNVIDNLLNSDMQAILISGTWGIGKTYAVKKYIDSKHEDIRNKKIKIAYSSLFGKTSIEDINTELYQLFHPKMKVVNLITKVAKLANIGANLTCGISLDLNEDNLKTSSNLKANKKIPCLIIIDDLERKSDKIPIQEFLGYINNLLNQGFKILVLADLDTQYGKYEKAYEITKVDKGNEILYYSINKINLKDNILGDYKEKIFDRIYKITESPKEIIQTIFKEDFNLLDDYLINEFENNIRMASKIYSLYQQIKNHIIKKRYQNVLYDKIMKICVYTVKELMTNKYSKCFAEKCKESEYLNYMEQSFATYIANYDFSLNNDSTLLTAINNIYLNEDYSLFDSLLLPNDNEKILKSCFYFSDEDKVEIIKKQYELILSLSDDSNYNYTTINQLIRDWYTYASFINLSFICEDKLFNKLRNLNIELDSFGENKNFITFIERYNKYCRNQKKIEITKLLSSDNELSIKNGFHRLSENYYKLDDSSKTYLEEYLIKNNFLLKPLAGNITYEMWDLNHQICRTISDKLPKLKIDLYKLLKNIEENNKKDLSCSYRINSLIKQYCLNQNDDSDNI